MKFCLYADEENVGKSTNKKYSLNKLKINFGGGTQQVRFAVGHKK